MKLARERGWEGRKMNGLGYAAWPDRLFLPPHNGKKKFGAIAARRFWVEFKRPGEGLTPRQAEMHVDLKARGEDVYTCESRAGFEALLKAHS